MSAAKKSSEPPSRLQETFQWLAGPGRPMALAVLIVALFGLGWYLAWQWHQKQLLASDAYWLSVQNVELTPLPAWIHSDIRSEVFRDATLDGPLSILDPKLAERIAAAFLAHPWVAKVSRVQKYHPARVQVDLVYRQPACMVDVAGVLLPVDGEGVLLPDSDFSAPEKARYPRLVGIETRPAGPVGARWGDVRVIGGAEVAAALAGVWERSGLERIVPSVLPGAAGNQECSYELVTRPGTRVFWGRAPGAATAGECSAADKIAKLQKYLADHGTLEGPTGPQQLDLTRQQSIEVGALSTGPGPPAHP
jgi:hypothetical protein